MRNNITSSPSTAPLSTDNHYHGFYENHFFAFTKNYLAPKSASTWNIV